MSLKKLLPVAVSIALVSALYVFIAMQLKISALWLPFISWTAYALDGASTKNIMRIAVCFILGLFIGYLTVALPLPLQAFTGAAMATPLIVFFMVTLILLTELTKTFNMIGMYFLGYSSYFAYYFGAFGGSGATPSGVLPGMILLAVLGLFLGFFSTEIRKRILAS